MNVSSPICDGEERSSAAADFGAGHVDSLQDFQADLELLAEVTARVAGRNADMWERISADERPDYYALVTTSRRMLTNADVGFVCAHEEHMPLGKHKRPQWLMMEFGFTSLEARGIMAAVERLDDRPKGPDVRPSKKYMPKIHELVKNGTLNEEGVRRVDKAIKSMPDRTHDLLVERGDKIIADLAEQCGPEVLNELNDLLWALLGEEEPEYEPKDHRRKRGIKISRQGADGMSSIKGCLTPRCAAVFQRLLADHATAGGLLKDSELGDHGFNDDPRSPSQRAHDCLESALFNSFSREERETLREEFGDAFGEEFGEWGSQANDSSNYEEEGLGEEGLRRRDVEEKAEEDVEEEGDEEFIPPLRDFELKPRRGSTSIVAVVNLRELLEGRGFGLTDTNMKIGMNELIEGTLARDFYLQVLDLNGRTLWLGRSRRLGSLDQYLALCGEEGGSTAPGSTAPPARCHMHHIKGWEEGGMTDLENLTFADPRMHARVDDSRKNRDRWWTLSADPSTGDKVIWIPPGFDDPQRRPRQNSNPTTTRTPGRKLQDGARRRWRGAKAERKWVSVED